MVEPAPSLSPLTRVLRFCSVGLGGFVVDLAVYTALVAGLGASHYLARIVAFWTSATWNWFGNRSFTFVDAEYVPKRGQWLKYIAMCLVSFVASFGVYVLLARLLPDIPVSRYVAFMAGVGAGAVLNYIGASGFVFRTGARSPGSRGGDP